MIHLESLPQENLYLFKITGDIDETNVEFFTKTLTDLASKNKKIKLIGEIHSMPGFESFKAFFETMKMKSVALSVIEKYVVLTDADWIGDMVSIGNFLTPGIAIKHFDLGERNKAVNWLLSTDS